MEPPLPILENHWRRSCEAIGIAVPKGVFEALAERYREPHRAYHTLQHIGECISHLSSLKSAPAELGVAIWFHDAICDPRASDNEKRSAGWAEAVLAGNAAASAVKRMILATRHEAVPEDAASKLLADIDLAILASPEPRYSEYEAQIRHEYAHLDEATWRAGRRRLLQGFVDRPFIFGTSQFRSRFESRARRNLERSINAMIVAKR
jgi:predicted metal-dependent HD superfamily phosphohydrolase